MIEIDELDWIFCLDLGSECTGYSYGVNEDLIKYGKYVAKKIKKSSPQEKLYNFSRWLSNTINSLPTKPKVIVIESPYYSRNVKTYGVLNQYLGVALRELYRLCNNPEILFIAPSKVKSVIKSKKSRNYYERKYNMVKKINKLYGLNLNYHKSNKNKSDDDIADAIALLYAFYNMNKDG